MVNHTMVENYNLFKVREWEYNKFKILYLQYCIYRALLPGKESNIDTVFSGTFATNRIQWFPFLLIGMNIHL